MVAVVKNYLRVRFRVIPAHDPRAINRAEKHSITGSFPQAAAASGELLEIKTEAGEIPVFLLDFFYLPGKINAGSCCGNGIKGTDQAKKQGSRQKSFFIRHRLFQDVWFGQKCD